MNTVACGSKRSAGWYGVWSTGYKEYLNWVLCSVLWMWERREAACRLRIETAVQGFERFLITRQGRMSSHLQWSLERYSPWEDYCYSR